MVDVALDNAGTWEYPLPGFGLELFTVQHTSYPSAGGFLGVLVSAVCLSLVRSLTAQIQCQQLAKPAFFSLLKSRAVIVG